MLKRFFLHNFSIEFLFFYPIYIFVFCFTTKNFALLIRLSVHWPWSGGHFIFTPASSLVAYMYTLVSFLSSFNQFWALIVKKCDGSFIPVCFVLQSFLESELIKGDVSFKCRSTIVRNNYISVRNWYFQNMYMYYTVTSN